MHTTSVNGHLRGSNNSNNKFVELQTSPLLNDYDKFNWILYSSEMCGKSEAERDGVPWKNSEKEWGRNNAVNSRRHQVVVLSSVPVPRHRKRQESRGQGGERQRNNEREMYIFRGTWDWNWDDSDWDWADLADRRGILCKLLTTSGIPTMPLNLCALENK